MKKKNLYLIFLLSICALLTVSGLVACTNESTSSNSSNTDSSYIIKYADDLGTHTISVKQGEPYSIDTLPTREGYEFLGLFNAEIGGTQYINQMGISIMPFLDGMNLVLFPQFKAKEYILALDYQGAFVSGVREIVVSYDSRIENLPLGLTFPNKEFMGWYTEPNREGLQVADQYGVIPNNSVLNSDNFDISNTFINLYAGFRGELKTVMLYYKDGASPVEEQIEYGTPVNEVGLDLRVDGNAVISWSLKPNDTEKTEIYEGNITSDMVLYAAEYAPVIDFDSQGAQNIKSIIAPAGSLINLPTPDLSGKVFAGWYDESNVIFNETTMPSESVVLSAKWLTASDEIIEYKRLSSKKDNGYDTNNPETDSNWTSRHNGWELGQIILSGTAKNNTQYFIPTDGSISLYFKLLQNPNALPINHTVVTSHVLSSDTWTGSVSGTSIRGVAIGKGAYWIKVIYNDGTTDEVWETNFLNNKTKGDIVKLKLPSGMTNKKIKSIDVKIVYELFSTGPGVFGIAWEEYPNWNILANILFA